MRSSDDLLACPACGGGLAELRCAACGVQYAEEDGIADLRVRSSDARTEAVRAFYLRAPFPGYPPRDSLSALRARAGRSDFVRLLDRSIDGDASVLELGCGTGQLSLFLATAERRIVGADLSRASLLLAARAAERYRLRGVCFVESDLRTPGLRKGAFDVVIASGVLHHTPDPKASFAAMVKLVKPGGAVVVGLYNSYARLPLRLRRAVHKLTGKVPFDPVLRDRKAEPARREAWLRDQYEHPEEHRHTLAEVQGWFRENGVDYLRAYPSPLLAEEPPDSLFQPLEDNWPLENLISQLAWARTLGGEGGLFVTAGRVQAAGWMTRASV
ncbi:MAG TPA: class I SAM-dependent methyltransferase [Myxococcales bacterium]|jgi:SAM-dependent methyltransferase|nr:class I SAM-dependent methyltransferase [Myxococcales bacterium]